MNPELAQKMPINVCVQGKGRHHDLNASRPVLTRLGRWRSRLTRPLAELLNYEI